MGSGFAYGVGGGSNEGQYAWKKRKATSSWGDQTWINIRNDGYGQTTLTLGDDILIRADGIATLVNPHSVSLQGSPYLCGYFGHYGGMCYVNATTQQLSNSNGVPLCCFYATPIATSAPLVSYIVDDDATKFMQTTAPPGEYIYERIS